MNATATPGSLMADRKAMTFQIKCDRSWMERVKLAAERLGISAAAYLRMVASRQMDADGIPHPKPKK